jgi:short-subunit dehydrogenase
MALNLAGQDTKLILAARRAELLEQVAAECLQLGAEAYAVQTDISDEAQCKSLVTQAIEKFGRVDLLINNAGLAVTALFEDLPNLQLFKHTLDVNFYGNVHCCYYALPFLKQSRGRILAISSLGGKAAVPYNTPYISSKYALHGFYDALRMELMQHGVSVTVVCPSWVVTGFHEAQMDKDGVPKGARGRAVYTEKTMTAECCARICLQATYRRRREVLMGPGHMAAWLRLLAPGFLDWFAVNVFLKSAVRRARQNASRS